MNAHKPLAMIVAAMITSITLADVAQADALAGGDATDRSGITTLVASDAESGKLPATGRLHKYRFDTTTNYWSVVALWSPPAGDVDLDVYDAKGGKQLLATSAAGTALTDFVAVDGNHRPAGDYFPSVRTHSGTGTYYVEYASGGKILGAEPVEVQMLGDDIVEVFDTYLVAGTTYTFTLEAGSSLQNGDLYLLGSSAGDPSTWVRTRGQSLRSGTSTGLGGTETFTYTPVVSDYYGLVVVNEAAGGTLTLSRTS